MKNITIEDIKNCDEYAKSLMDSRQKSIDNIFGSVILDLKTRNIIPNYFKSIKKSLDQYLNPVPQFLKIKKSIKERRYDREIGKNLGINLSKILNIPTDDLYKQVKTKKRVDIIKDFRELFTSLYLKQPQNQVMSFDVSFTCKAFDMDHISIIHPKKGPVLINGNGQRLGGQPFFNIGNEYDVNVAKVIVAYGPKFRTGDSNDPSQFLSHLPLNVGSIPWKISKPDGKIVDAKFQFGIFLCNHKGEVIDVWVHNCGYETLNPPKCEIMSPICRTESRDFISRNWIEGLSNLTGVGTSTYCIGLDQITKYNDIMDYINTIVDYFRITSKALLYICEKHSVNILLGKLEW